MERIKCTDLYGWCRKTYKEYKQRGYLINIEEKILEDSELLNIKNKFMGGITKYLQNITIHHRYGCFSDDVQEETIYSYVYYLMLCHFVQYSIPDRILCTIKEKLLNVQHEDGFCYDINLINYNYLNGDGWGRRHFIPHYFIALNVIGCVPRYHFRYLSAFYDKKFIYEFWNSLDWVNAWSSSNIFMNIVCTLQYERDYMGNIDVQDAIEASQKWLLDHIRDDCGMWYEGNMKKKAAKMEAIRAAYHLYPVLVYDQIDFPYKEKAIDLILECQNKFGGFDIRKNSSACEDIDAIEPLIRLSILCPKYRKEEIRLSIKKAFGWVVQNQMLDGGCVFRLGEDFDYGHVNLSSKANQSNLFGTWFRTLSVCYMYNYLSKVDQIQLYRLPGYEFSLNE